MTTIDAKYRYVIGIDPGVNTGISFWSIDRQQLLSVGCGGFIAVQEMIKLLPNRNEYFIRFEDARQRRWFGSKGREALQGAGSIKRDCQLWEDFLRREGFAFEMVPPARNKTKLDAATFRKITGWKGITNEHARDSAFLCYQFNPPVQHYSNQ